ncbi:toll/interleukin-1 receptor domain-containing protein [Vibrio echinoideorum]|uniref:Toll/interleukin-1 receptor domain-containing protein n=1 Tax=Vibrio echinoideorum TaxID=2100116 RepID=A0ABU9FLJ4_9VIBR
MANKVFISYAHESEVISDNILDFSNSLRAEGIDAEIDQYEECPAEGWPKWMMRQVQESNFVLVCCTKLFFDRANDFSGGDDGLGVKWETSLILQQLYALNTGNTKFIPIIFDLGDKKYIPLALQPYTFYQLSNEHDIKKLINRLKGVSKSKRPPLGQTSEDTKSDTKLPPKERKSMFLSTIIDLELWGKAKWSGMAFMSDPSLQAPPVACFMFENEKVGEEIFRGLKKQFGDVDKKEEMRLSFVEGISSKNPRDYKVHFGQSRDVQISKLKDYGLEPHESMLMIISRIQEMNPPTDPSSLVVFKHAFSHFKEYYVTNLVTNNGQPMPSFSNMIKKNSAVFRKMADVVKDKNDEDYVVVRNINKN